MKVIPVHTAVWLFCVFVPNVNGCTRIPSFGGGDDSDDSDGNGDTEYGMCVAETGPVSGMCMCVAKENVVLRTTGCQDTTIRLSSNKNHCFEYRGRMKTCQIKGVPVNYYVIDYQGQERLIGKPYMAENSQPELCIGCDHKYLRDLCPDDPTKKLTNEEAKQALDDESIIVYSSQRPTCYNRNVGTCTSLTDVNCVNIKGIIWLKRMTGLDLIITGGTETGHSGQYSKTSESHWNGFKIDIRYRDPSSGNLLPISTYIPQHFEYIGIRSSDKALSYVDRNGFEYNYEWDLIKPHWDIKYPKGSCIKKTDYTLGRTMKTMCVTGSGVNVRNSACDVLPNTVTNGSCFASKGENKICVIRNKPYNLHRLVINGEDVWIASINLEIKLSPKRKRRSTKCDDSSTSTDCSTKYGDLTKLRPTGALGHTSGVKASRRMLETDLKDLNNKKKCYEKVGKNNCLEPALIAALASRESRGGRLLHDKSLGEGYGDGGKAYGILQCDIKNSGLKCTSHKWDSCEHMDMMMKKIFLPHLKEVKAKHEKWTSEMHLQGTVASYNFGVKSVSTWKDLDKCSAGDDYSNDVLARAQYLKRIWNSNCGRQKVALAEEQGVLSSGEYPWHVIIKRDGIFICSGSIINQWWILTTSHCLKTTDKKTGNEYYDLDASHYTLNAGLSVKYNADKVINHSEMNLALIKTKLAIKSNEYTQPVCLPYPGEEFDDYEECYITGTKMNLSDELEDSKMQIRTKKECNTQIDKSIKDKAVCASHSTDSNYKGNNGSPLACKDKHSTWTLAGVRLPLGPSDSSQYLSFTNISGYVGWIDENAFKVPEKQNRDTCPPKKG